MSNKKKILLIVLGCLLCVCLLLLIKPSNNTKDNITNNMDKIKINNMDADDLTGTIDDYDDYDDSISGEDFNDAILDIQYQLKEACGDKANVSVCGDYNSTRSGSLISIDIYCRDSAIDFSNLTNQEDINKAIWSSKLPSNLQILSGEITDLYGVKVSISVFDSTGQNFLWVSDAHTSYIMLCK